MDLVDARDDELIAVADVIQAFFQLRSCVGRTAAFFIKEFLATGELLTLDIQ